MFPQRKPLVEGERAAVSDTLAVEQGDMAAQHSSCHVEKHRRFAQLQLDTHTGE